MTETRLHTESTLTERYQTTVPSMVREALQLGKRDKICYTVQTDGRVLMSRAGAAQDDPALESFLDFLAEDINQHPEHLQAISPALLGRIRALVKDIEMDLDAPLSDEDE